MSDQAARYMIKSTYNSNVGKMIKLYCLQIDRSTVKIVVWFDNEHGYANRIVDLVKKCYDVNSTK